MADQANLRRALVTTGYAAGALLAVFTGAPLLLVPAGALIVGFAIRALTAAAQ